MPRSRAATQSPNSSQPSIYLSISLRSAPRELGEEILLALAEVPRELDVDLGIQIATTRSIQMWHALPGQTDALAIRRLGRNLQRQVRALGRGHHHLATKNGGVQRC